MATLTEDLQFRELVYQMSGTGLRELLDDGQLTAYIGFDPSSDSLHVGHLVQLCNLRRLQLVGHAPIVVAGGGTGLIGDPGGKVDERPLLDRDQVQANLVAIRPQLERFLDFTPSATGSSARLLDNAQWLASISYLDFLRDVGKHFTVNQMVSRDSVAARLERPDRGISYTEFSYMLLQAYDYLHLFEHYGCRLQMGASDQWGNITMGVELIRKVRGGTAWALTSPLVLKADGTKFGKTESGGLYLDAGRTSPFEFYQYFVRCDDEAVGRYLRFFTFLEHEQILALDKATAERPQQREAQRALAHEVCVLVHGEQETASVERAVDALYSEDIAQLDARTLLMALGDAPSTSLSKSTLDGDGLDLVEVLVNSGLSPSRNVARTTIAQGGVYINNRRADADRPALRSGDVIAGGYVLVRRGRQNLHLLCFA